MLVPVQGQSSTRVVSREIGWVVGLGRLVKAGLPTATMERFAAALTRPTLAACRAVSLERCQDSRVCSAALLLLDAVFSRVPESGRWEGAAHTGVDVGECVAVLGALLGEQGVGLQLIVLWMAGL